MIFHIDGHVVNYRTCSLILFVVVLLGSLRFRFTPGAAGSETTTIGETLLFPFAWPLTIGIFVAKRCKLALYQNIALTLSAYLSKVEIHTYAILVFLFLFLFLFLLLLVPVLFAFLDGICQRRQSYVSNPVITAVVAVDSRKFLLPIDLSWCLAPHRRYGGATVDALKSVRIVGRREDNTVAIQNIVGGCLSIRL
jgi:hypothetical protein